VLIYSLPSACVDNDHVPPGITEGGCELPTEHEKLETQFPWINREYIEAFNKIATVLTSRKASAGGGLHRKPETIADRQLSR
jgi:hypothetical protein